ncbi:hypothetical protein NSB20_02820 [Bacteroides acidifaciens]|uniref:Hsp70 family protein n=1 Tax=Bacteroides acidifaciens TaxID=85831 RepID=UPI002149CDAF|nr:hypothetical protein [Bacteroides acidifaciens]MCR2004492.1 hypothetical protein [Bacteroides acidifaciens]
MQDKKYNWAIVPDKNRHEYVIGIDFGHGETSAAFCPIGWDLAPGDLEAVKDVDFGANRKVLPTAINIQPNGQAFLGEAAFSSERLRKATVEVLFKKKPENIDGEKEQLMIRYMHEVYALIREKTGALFSDENHLLYIATPSGWDEKAKNLYGQMAAKAGLPIAGITSESRAAFIKAQLDTSSGLPQYISQGAIVFDMGSSTLDFTYLQSGNAPIDYGYDCGASQVEKIMYAEIREKNKDIIAFETQYPKLVAKLLYETRCAKEGVYFDPDIRYKKTVNFEDIVDDEDFEDSKMKFVFQPGELNHMLEEKGYISEVRQAMLDFKDYHIGGYPIKAAFLTGGASRMGFIQALIEDCWGLPQDLIYRDQDPSLTISRGVAEVARSDFRSGGVGNTKQLLNDIVTESDVYTPFVNSLCDKLSEEIIGTVGACVTNFRDNETDVSINDLQAYIEENISEDLNQVGDWAMECYKEAFENQTKEIRDRLDKIISNYSRQGIRMGNVQVSISSLPNIDMSVIAEQMRQLSSNFTDGGIVNGLVTGIAGAAVGGAIAMLLGGPLAWLIGGGAILANWFFGEEKTEEQKRQEALAKDLDHDQRQQVFDEFNNSWEDICNKIQKAVEQSICSNYTLQRTIQSQSKATIESYVKECIEQTRLMVE